MACLPSSQQHPPGPSSAADGLSNAEDCPPLPESHPAYLEPGFRGPRPRIPIWALPCGRGSFPGTVGGLPGREGHCGE